MNTHANRRILVIDDSQAIHDDFRKILCSQPTVAGPEGIADMEAALFGAKTDTMVEANFEITSAYQGAEGLKRVREAVAAGRPYAVAFVDVRMPPGWDGIETTSEIWKVDPDLQIVICTAYSDYSWEEMLAKVGRSDRLVILKKPFDNVEALQLAEALTTKWRLTQETKQKLQQSEGKFRRLFENARDSIFIMDQEGKLMDVNREACERLQFTRAELLRMGALEFHTTESAGRARQYIRQVLETGHHVYEVEYITRKGAVIPMEVSAQLLEHEGQMLVLAICRDFTERKRTERQIRLQNSALEAAANSIFITSRTGDILWVNSAFERLTGYTAAEAIGRTSALLKSGVHEPAFYQQLWKTILGGNVWQGELINRRKDGTLYHEEMTITPVRDEFGAIQNFIAIKQDISPRKKFEKDLARERDLLQALMDNLPDYIYFKDVHSRFTRINQALARHLGLNQPEEATGQSDLDYFSARAARQKFVEEQRLLTTGEPLLGLIETSETMHDRRWVSSTKVPLRDATGQITGLVGISRDITEFKLAEDAVRASEARYHSLFNNMLEGFARCRMVFDNGLPVDFVYLEVNSAFAALTGLEEVIGKSACELMTGIRESNRELLELYGRVAQSGKPERVETFVPSLNRWFNIAVYSYEPGEFVAIFDNITAAKEAEAARRQMEVQLRQGQKLEAIGQLAAGIAHEINTPTQYVGDNTRFLQDSFASITTATRAYADLLTAAKKIAERGTRNGDSANSGLRTPDSEFSALVTRAEQAAAAADLDYLFAQIPAAIKETLEGVDRVTKIVRAMKEFSHPGGKERAAADLNRAIESTVTVARNEWKYVADLKLELDSALPLVPCFLGEFNQSILNLVVNASHAISDVVKANPGARGTITVSTKRDGDFVEVRIGDTGTGIPESARAHIFEPFFTTKGVGRGTGQGLAIVYTNIVKKHGGTARFETEVGKGTTFVLRLPLTVPGSAFKVQSSGLANSEPGTRPSSVAEPLRRVEHPEPGKPEAAALNA